MGLDQKRSTILKRYGITFEEYEKRKDEQGDQCFMCGKPGHCQTNGLSLDHDHSTGQLRKFLCSRCNMIVGIIEAGDGVVAMAFQYIEDFYTGRLP
jgi:hypothetical protein